MRFRFNFVLPLLPALSGVSKALVGVGERGADDPGGKFFHESTVSLLG